MTAGARQPLHEGRAPHSGSLSWRTMARNGVQESGPTSEPPEAAGEYPRFAPHLWPRTRGGRIAVLAFLGLFALTQPPLVYWIGNRIEPRLVGLPFLFWYLLLIYLGLIAVLLWARMRDL